MTTPEQIIGQQKADAEKLRRKKADAAMERHNGNVPAVTKATSLVADIDTRSVAERYADTIAASSIVGQLIKFSKDGKFTVSDTGNIIDPEDDFIALCDETLIGWIKFIDDQPPERHQGLLYQGFAMPARESLGDTDEAQWPDGLNGQPTDPWQHQNCLVLQHVATGSMYTFSTSSVTGRRAVGSLLQHYNRMQRRNPDAYPVVRLKPSGFQHKKVGWVATPSFVVVGSTPKNSAATPDTSVAADMSDAIPF